MSDSGTPDRHGPGTPRPASPSASASVSASAEPVASAGPAGAGGSGTGPDAGPDAGLPHELRAAARTLDAEDPLARYRALFVLDDDTVYLDGNSLGALPRAVPGRLADVVAREWGRLRIRSWTEAGWWDAPERVGERIAPLVGAAPGQVVVADSTSVNVFKAVVGALRLARAGDPAREEVLLDAETFPSDGYVAASAARMTGATLRTVPAAELGRAAGRRTAVLLANHVDYRTGELRDMAALTAAAHGAGARTVWDVCHSAGALPVELDACGVDFAVGCTYKYLNGGPGAPAFLYVRREHQPRFDSPLPGWSSHADPFAMAAGYEAAPGAGRGRVGTPDILSLLAAEEALKLWEGVDLRAVRAKSLALTGFFLRCLDAYVPAPRARPVTPRAPERRGSQVSVRCPDAAGTARELLARGVVVDFRPPDVLRFGFAPLYNAFADAERAARALADAAGGGVRDA